MVQTKDQDGTKTSYATNFNTIVKLPELGEEGFGKVGEPVESWRAGGEGPIADSLSKDIKVGASLFGMPDTAIVTSVAVPSRALQGEVFKRVRWAGPGELGVTHGTSSVKIKTRALPEVSDLTESAYRHLARVEGVYAEKVRKAGSATTLVATKHKWPFGRR